MGPVLYLQIELKDYVEIPKNREAGLKFSLKNTAHCQYIIRKEIDSSVNLKISSMDSIRLFGRYLMLQTSLSNMT